MSGQADSNPLAFRPPLGPDACFEAHRGRVYRWAAVHGLEHHQRLDIVQETFARLVASAPTFPHAAAQVAWLRRVASNACVDAIRRPRPTSLSSAREPASFIRDPLDVGEDARALAAVLPELSPMQREVLLAKCVDEQTFAQIAAELGIAIPTAKTHYLRALESLRAKLDPPPSITPRAGSIA